MSYEVDKSAGRTVRRILGVVALTALAVIAFNQYARSETFAVMASPVVTATPRHVARPAAPTKPAPVKIAKRLFTGEGHVEDPPDWPFPISCDRVRWFAAHFSEASLEKMRIARGLAAPTPEERRIGKACINAKPQATS